MLHISFKVTLHSLTILGSVQRCKIKSKIKWKKILHSKKNNNKKKNSRFKGSRHFCPESWGAACAFGGGTQTRLFKETLTAERAERHTEPSVGSLLLPPKKSDFVGAQPKTRLDGRLQGGEEWRFFFFTDRLQAHECLHNVGSSVHNVGPSDHRKLLTGAGGGSLERHRETPHPQKKQQLCDAGVVPAWPG